MKQIIASLVAGFYLFSLNPMFLYAQESRNMNIVSLKNIVAVEKKSSALIKACEGGKVELDGACVEIPANALEKDTEISITRLATVAETGEGLENVTCGGGGYRFLPAGTKFKVDATISLPYERSVQDGTLEDTCTYFYDTDIKEWVALERIDIDKNTNSIISRTSHFTDMINGAPSMPESPSPANVSLNSIKNLETANPSGIVLPLQGLEPSPTGEASFSFDLEIPSGLHGMQPHVSLSYSSGSGSGNAGRGFAINTGSSITTDTRHGLPFYDGINDTYMKDGVLLKRDGETSDIYKPLKEGAYETIKALRLGSGSQKIISWEVTSKDGTVRTYGNTARSYSSPTEDSFSRFSWYLTKETDTHGNIIDYDYIEDNGSIYVSSISYSGNRITFEYENREDVRVDARGRFVQKSALRIKKISTYYGTTPLKVYSFSYEYGLAKQSFLVSFSCRTSGADSDDWNYSFEYEKPDRIGGKVFAFDTTMREWANGKPLNVQNSASSGSNVTFSGGGGIGLRKLAPIVTYGRQGSSSSGNSYTDYITLDINGDGVLDCVRQISSDTLVINKGNSDGSFNEGVAVSNLPLSYKIGKESNKNSSSGTLVYGGITTPLPVSAGVTRSSIKQSGESKVHSMFSDVDGDGLVDILETENPYYLKNTSTDSEISFEKRPLSNNVNGIYREYTATEKKDYNSTFYVQTPFRAWRIPYSGNIVLEHTAEWNGGNAHDRFADIRVFHGDKCIDSGRVSSSTESYKKSLSLSVKAGDYIYFVSSHNNDSNSENAYDVDLRESDIKWNADIIYSDFKPFDKRNLRLFFAKPEEETVTRTELTDDLLQHVYNDYPEVDDLYECKIIGNKSDGQVVSYTATWSLKTDWRDFAHNADGCARYFIDKNLFVPVIIKRSQFEDLLSHITDADKSEFSCFLFDAEHDVFHVSEITQSSDEYLERMQTIWNVLNKYETENENYISEILRASLNVFDFFGYTVEWITDEKIEFSMSQKTELGDQRENKKPGSIFKNGSEIILGKYDGKEARIDNGRLYLDDRLANNKVEVFADSEADCLSVTISSGKGVDAESVHTRYKFDSFTKIATRLDKDELKNIRNALKYTIGADREFITSPYWASFPPEILETDDFYNYLKDNEKKTFLSCFEFGPERETVGNEPVKKVYKRNKALSASLKATVNNYLDEYSFDCFFKNIASLFYENLGAYYYLKDKCKFLSERSLLENEIIPETPEEFVFYARAFQSVCLEKRYGKYLNQTVSVAHTPHSFGEITSDGEHFILLSDKNEGGSISVFYSTFGKIKLDWHTESDFSPLNIQTERKIGEVDFATDSILYGGVNNWYYGIWNGTWNENNFSQSKLHSVYESIDKPETFVNSESCNSEGEKLSQKVAESGDEASVPNEFVRDNIFSHPVSYNSDNCPILFNPAERLVESDTGEYLSQPDFVLGDFSVKSFLTEVWTAEGNLEQIQKSKYYVPFISRNGIIHANRCGGSSFYDILFESHDGLDALRKTETNGYIKKVNAAINAGAVTDTINLVGTANAVANILTDKGFDINLNNLTGYTANLGGDASAKMVQNIIDINGDSIPDLIQSNGLSSLVYYGALENDGTVTYKQSRCAGVENLGYMSGSDVENERIYNGSLSPLGALVPRFNGKAKFLGAALTGAFSATGISASKSENSQKYGFIDINGDGLSDYVNCGKVFLNLGGNKFKEFQTEHQISNLGEGANLSVGLSINPANLFFSQAFPQLSSYATPTLSLSDTSSATISTVSYNDINGDGLVDKVVKEMDDEHAVVYYNNGTSFESGELIDFSPWDVQGCVAQYLRCSDGDVFKDSWVAGLPFFNSGAMTDFAYFNPFGATEEIMKRYTNMLDFSNTMTISFEGGLGKSIDIPIPIPLFLITLYIHVNIKADAGANSSYSFTGVTTQLTDINGDGLPDRVLRIPGGTVGGTSYAEHTFVQLNKMGTVGLLRAVNLPQGGRYEIDYEFVHGSTRAGSGRYAMRSVTKIENPNVSSDYTSLSYKAADGTSGIEESVNRYVTTFSYLGGYYDRSIKEFFGYDKVISVQGTGKEAVTAVTEYYNSEYYNKSMTKKTTLSDSDGIVYSVQEFEIDEAPYARVTKKTETSYEHNDQSGGISVKTEYEYGDDWGNVTALHETTSGNTKDIYAEFEYAKGITLNHGLVAEIRVYEGSSPSADFIRKRCATYNKAGDMLSLSTYYDRNSCSTYNFDYESDGNIKSVTDPNGMTSRFMYYSDPRFIKTVSVTGKGCDTYTSEFEWEFARALKTKETDQNGNSMRYEYDLQGRLKKVWTPEDKDSPAVSYEYYVTDDGVWYSITNNKTLYDRSISYENPVIQSVAVSDGLGRVKWTAKTGCVTDGGTETKSGWNVSGLVTYDSLSRTKAAGMVQFSEAVSIDSLLYDEKILVNPSYTEYDAKGRTVRSILPLDSEGNAPESMTEYLVADGGQKTVATDPLGNRTVQVSDARGNIIYLEKQDGLGRKLTSVNYSYDVIGQMLEAYNEEPEKPITVGYDLAGRITTLASPDSGEKRFVYDESGNKIREYDSLLLSKGEMIKYQYDGMNRLVLIDYPESVDTVYEYGRAGEPNNGAGKIIKTTDSTGTIEYKYGSLGEVVEETRSIYQMSANDGDGTSISATMSYVSDYLGRMQEITYPDGEVVTYGYDEGGQVNRVSGVRGSYSFDYVNNITYDEYGQRAYLKYANGTETYYTYDKARRWLSHIRTENPFHTIQNTDYKFDFVGNVLKTSDDCDLWRTSQSYDYDSLYQLVSATGTTTYTANGVTDYATSTYTQKFSFDNTGNMLTKVSTVQNSAGFTTKNNNSLDYNLAYTYSPGFAHRLSNVNGRYYAYDKNGNLTVEQDAPIEALADTSVLTPIFSERVGKDVYKEDYGWAVSNPDRGKKKNTAVSTLNSGIYQRKFIWDERNMLIQSSDALHTVRYRYGADGQRTNKFSMTTDSGETIYFNKLWTWRHDSYTPNAGNYCKNIFLDKTRIVTKVRAADETSSADAHREYFYHGDHLQSATLITDYEGSVYERINYTPYGELWLEKSDNNGENYLPYRFTGKELDSETGLYYYGARYLDPMYSRWLSTDPALGEYIPQAPISDEAKKHNQNLPGMGGVFNQLNSNLYHYAGNNPVRYVDPDGKLVFLAIPAAIGVKVFVAWTLSLAVCGAAGYAIGKSTQDIINYSKEQAQNSNNVSDSLKQNAQTPASAAGSPSPNDGNGGEHGKDDHDNEINKKIQEVKEEGGKNIRKNQQQVDASGKKVGNNRPDVQWDDKDGNHHCWEIDRNPKSSANHGAVISSNDPNAIVELVIMR